MGKAAVVHRKRIILIMPTLFKGNETAPIDHKRLFLRMAFITLRPIARAKQIALIIASEREREVSKNNKNHNSSSESKEFGGHPYRTVQNGNYVGAKRFVDLRVSDPIIPRQYIVVYWELFSGTNWKNLYKNRCGLKP